MWSVVFGCARGHDAVAFSVRDAGRAIAVAVRLTIVFSGGIAHGVLDLFSVGVAQRIAHR